ncbi:MAG: hypothetical protein CM15mP49_26120 [Actinomycetota bacterium]|nr:MAG: hypothetical protein CM15mP49_26120 [Actinomycetota bacterium]
MVGYKQFQGPCATRTNRPCLVWGQNTVDKREALSHASERSVMKTICSVGGDNGWFAFNWLWAIRGFVDKLLGGLDFVGVADTQAIFALEIPWISLRSRPLHLTDCVCLPK